MRQQQRRLRVLAFIASLTLLTFSGLAAADPPSRVARLGFIGGAVSFSPAGEHDWIRAAINRPLTTGDRLWADARSRAEIQFGGAMIRMHAGTSVSILNLDDRIVQLQLTQGILNVRVRRLEPDQAFEVDTPNLAFTLRQPGEYRIEVNPDGNATTLVVRRGRGEAYGEQASYVIDSRQPYRFFGTGLREYQYVDLPPFDEFDRWSSERDRRYDTSTSARFVSGDVVGYQDLDANGTWRVDATYGNVWIPTRVAAGWAPYRDGHWAWVDPWGWTWVDDAPWGFAVSHYGRWANFDGTWGWVPGPVRTRAYYAPALVAFVGGNNLQLTISGGNVGGVAWFPLGPSEFYRPSYTVSRRYFEDINRSNTVISNTVNTTVINNYYTNTNVTNVVYANQKVPGAVVAVPTAAFVQSQPVAKAAVRVTQEVAFSAPVSIMPAVAPTERSVRGSAPPADTPPPRVFERPIVARTAPPAAPVGFLSQQPQLAAKPGAPLDDTARKELKPAALAPAPVVKVVAPAPTASPAAAPPPPALSSTAPAPAAAAGKAGEGVGKADDRKPATPGLSGLPSGLPPAPVPGAAPPRQVVPVPAPVSPPTGSSANPSAPAASPQSAPSGPPRSGSPVAIPPPQPAVPQPPIASPQGVAPPAAQPPDLRGKGESQNKGEPRAQPAIPPSASPQATTPTQGAPKQSSPPVLPAQSPEARAKSDGRAQPVAPPPRPPEPKAIAPQLPPQIPPQVVPRPPEAKAVPQPVVPAAPAAQQQPAQRSKPLESGPGEKVGEPRPPAPIPGPPPAAAKPQPAAPAQPAVQPQPPAQPQAAPKPQPAAQPQPVAPPPPTALPPSGPKGESRNQDSKPVAGKPEEKKKDAEELKREEEERKRKG